jgi:hypothetical protein
MAPGAKVVGAFFQKRIASFHKKGGFRPPFPYAL